MAIEFTVVCSRPLPADWIPEAAFELDLPFNFWLESVADWQPQLDRVPEGEWSFVARFQCAPEHADLVAECCLTLTDQLGGFFYDDDGELSDVADGGHSPGMSGSELIALWRELAQDQQLLATPLPGAWMAPAPGARPATDAPKLEA